MIWKLAPNLRDCGAGSVAGKSQKKENETMSLKCFSENCFSNHRGILYSSPKAYALLCFVFWALLGITKPTSAQQDQFGEVALDPLGTLEVVSRAGILTDSAAQVEQMIQGLATVEDLIPEIRGTARRHGELLLLFTSMTAADFVRLERLSRFQDQAILEERRLEDIHARLTARLVKLGEIHAAWTDRHHFWHALLDAMRTDGDLAVAKPEVVVVIQRIEQILKQATDAAALPQSLQVEAELLRTQFAQLGATVTAVQIQRRQVLFERTQPVLLSKVHRTQLREAGWHAWDPTAGIDRGAYLVFVRDNLGLLGFHLVLGVLIGVVARVGRLGAVRKGIDEWAAILDRPWALGIFISVVVALARITLAPPLWDALLWAIFGVTAAILGHQLIEIRALRRTIYLLAAFYPGFLLLEVAQFPDPVFRVGLAAVAAGSIPLFLQLARSRDPVADSDVGSEKVTARVTWPLRLGAGVWIWVLFVLIMGFHELARWTLHATVMSAAVVFTASIGFILIRTTAETLSRLKATGSIIRQAGVLLARRMIPVFRIVIIVMAVLVLFDTWGITGSPVATWQKLTDAGFTVGTLHVTVGRILLGALVVYVAVIVSGFARSLAVHRFGLGLPTDGSDVTIHSDMGLGESVTKLAQYAFVTLGFILALAVIGVELQSFALIGGALGIGVGFGLQNVVNNFASGLILLFERPVRVGDTVVVGDVFGTIQKIGFRSTVMLTLDKSEMIVPNGDLVAEKVVNWTLTSPIARMFVPVGVAYGSSIATVLAVLEKAAFAHDGVLKDPSPQALFMDFGDSSLNFELRVWVQDIRIRLEMRSVILADIDQRLREAGIEIPFPQRDLHLRSIDTDMLKQLVDRG